MCYTNALHDVALQGNQRSVLGVDKMTQKASIQKSFQLNRNEILCNT